MSKRISTTIATVALAVVGSVSHLARSDQEVVPVMRAEPPLRTLAVDGELLVYITVSNPRKEWVSHSYPLPDEPETIPVEWVLVRKDDKKLPFAHSTEAHAKFPSHATEIRPGGSYSLTVPIKTFVKLREDIAGQYELEPMGDYFPNNVGGKPSKFSIVQSFPEPKTLKDQLARQDWGSLKKRDLSAKQRKTLVSVVNDKEAAVALRVRAARLLCQGAQASMHLKRFVAHENPFVAIAALRQLPANPEFAGSVIAAMDHDDTSVRRLAANKLANYELTKEQKKTLFAIAKKEQDPEVLEQLSKLDLEASKRGASKRGRSRTSQT